METIKIILNEIQFTNSCKSGFINYNSRETGRIDIHLTNNDIKEMVSNNLISKKLGYLFEISTLNIDKDNIREIIKRSPLYSEIYYQI
jgi:hypothetical protein